MREIKEEKGIKRRRTRKRRRSLFTRHAVIFFIKYFILLETRNIALRMAVNEKVIMNSF